MSGLEGESASSGMMTSCAPGGRLRIELKSWERRRRMRWRMTEAEAEEEEEEEEGNNVISVILFAP